MLLLSTSTLPPSLSHSLSRSDKFISQSLKCTKRIQLNFANHIDARAAISAARERE